MDCDSHTHTHARVVLHVVRRHCREQTTVVKCRVSAHTRRRREPSPGGGAPFSAKVQQPFVFRTMWHTPHTVFGAGQGKDVSKEVILGEASRKLSTAVHTQTHTHVPGGSRAQKAEESSDDTHTKGSNRHNLQNLPQPARSRNNTSAVTV